jgi:hypothetical protein
MEDRRHNDNILIELATLGTRLDGALEELKAMRSDIKEVITTHSAQIRAIELTLSEQKGAGKVHGAIWGVLSGIMTGLGVHILKN